MAFLSIHTIRKQNGKKKGFWKKQNKKNNGRTLTLCLFVYVEE